MLAGRFRWKFYGTRCLGSAELVFEKRSVTVCYKMHMGRDDVKVKYNDPHKYASKLRGFLFTSSTNTVGHYGSQTFDSHKWPTVFVRDVK